MKTFKIACPTCKASIRVPTSLAGKKVSCPGCNQRILVPAPGKTLLAELIEDPPTMSLPETRGTAIVIIPTSAKPPERPTHAIRTIRIDIKGDGVIPLLFQCDQSPERIMEVIDGILRSAGMRINKRGDIVGEIDYSLGWQSPMESTGYVETSNRDEPRVLVVLTFEKVFRFRQFWPTAMMFATSGIFRHVLALGSLASQHHAPNQCRIRINEIANMMRRELREG
jgi:predicted Zn finger-like uncharacterized protein